MALPIRCKGLLSAIAATVALSPTFAQVYMPDPNLRSWVDNQFPGAIDGVFIDQAHPDVANATELQIINADVSNLTGIGAFGNLQVLVLEGNPLNGNTLEIPASLMSLGMIDCGLSGTLDLCFAQNSSLQTLSVQNNQLTSIAWCGDRPSVGLNASHNLLAGWTGEPPSDMGYMNLAHNALATVPDGLLATWIDVSHNQLTDLPWTYWATSQTLIAHHNLLTTLPEYACTFMNGLLDLSYNLIEAVTLPAQVCDGTGTLDLSHNPLTGGITNLPSALRVLTITDTQLDCLPQLPLTLEELVCTGNSFTCLPNIPEYLDLAQANFGFEPMVCVHPMPCSIAPPSLVLRACLQGAWDPDLGLMRDDLRAQGLVPLTEPYSAAGYAYMNNVTPLTITADMLETEGPEAIVDWVIIEWRTAPDMPGLLQQSVPALMLRNGSVIATTGEPLHYMQIPQGNYRIAVKHRNHLGAITFSTPAFGAGTTTVDIMAAAGTQVNPFAIAAAPDGTRMLVMGDATSDKVVKYTGADNDRDPILQAIGGTIPTQVIAGQYRWEDLNMDGQVKYVGLDNDRDLILQVIGGDIPSNTRGQVPIY
ncbi:MAG: hypothetical protein IT225_08715 [Flavobacteriales bacterium]|jgi:hypothetical protein|nr:hypothetical protein [Flavobacteriales bacterium]